MSAIALQKNIIDSIQKRIDAGGRVSEFEYGIVAEAAQAEKPDPVADLAKNLTDQLAKIQSEGKKPSATLLKAAEEALKSAQGATIWPDAAACAQELGVSVQTARNWLGELGIPSARTSISKIEVYKGLWIRERDSIGKATASTSDADNREQELRIAERQARVDERTQRLVAVANDAAKAGLIAAVRDIRSPIINVLPSLLADVLATDQDRIQYEGKARKIISDQLEHICATLNPENPNNKGAINGQTQNPTPKAQPNQKA